MLSSAGKESASVSPLSPPLSPRGADYQAPELSPGSSSPSSSSVVVGGGGGDGSSPPPTRSASPPATKAELDDMAANHRDELVLAPIISSSSAAPVAGAAGPGGAAKFNITVQPLKLAGVRAPPQGSRQPETSYAREKFFCCGMMLREGTGFVLASFARSPAVILTALIGPLVVQFAQSDSLCGINPNTGLSPGGAAVISQACSTGGLTPTSSRAPWNDTLWRAVNGTACQIDNTFAGAPETMWIQDVGQADVNAGCAFALAAYRAETGFTCNCTGAYAFLPAGARPGTVLTISSTVVYVSMIIVAPVFGALVDISPHRKRLWGFTAVALGCTTLGFSFLGGDHLWAVALFSLTCAGCVYEMMFLPIVAYLPELHHDSVVRSNYAGYAQGANFAAQFIMGVFMLAFTLGLGPFLGSVGVAVISCVAATAWIFTGNWRALVRMDPREPGHVSAPGTSLCTSSFVSIAKTTKMLYREHPMAMRYLMCNLCGGTAVSVNISLITTYLAVQLQMTGSKIVIVYMITMTVGAPAAYMYGPCARRCGAKFGYIGLMLFCFAANAGLPFLINQPTEAHQNYVYLFAPLAGGYFGLFYSMQSVIFSNFIPVGEEAACYGLQSFSNTVIRWIPPLVYGAIVQATNDHRFAIIHPVVLYLIAAAIMATIDFDKGRADVAKKGKRRQTGSESARGAEFDEDELVSPGDEEIVTATL